MDTFFAVHNLCQALSIEHFGFFGLSWQLCAVVLVTISADWTIKNNIRTSCVQQKQFQNTYVKVANFFIDKKFAKQKICRRLAAILDLVKHFHI